MSELKIQIQVEKDSFLHIGAAPSPLTEKKGAVFKVDRTPIIPASSFKGALRHQLEIVLMDHIDELAKVFNLQGNEKERLKPCIPASNPSKGEMELIKQGKYRSSNCYVSVDKDQIETRNDGICPVCYFMGATGLMGFLRIPNLYPAKEGNILDQTNIRIDRSSQTAADKAKVDSEQVKPDTTFSGKLEIMNSKVQSFEFGNIRKIDGVILDKWMEKWGESNIETRKKILLEKILNIAISNIKLLGGQKSKGAGKVITKIIP